LEIALPGDCRLSRSAQAHPESISGAAGLRSLTIVGIFCAAIVLPACGAGGFSLKRAEVDRSLYTSNVPASQTPYDADRLSDEATIRNAVTSADIETLGGAPLPWANAQTGARGQVTNIAESRADGILCRSFRVSRESFDGVAMFKGEACMASPGAWKMQDLQSL